MADHFTHFSCVLDVGSAENAKAAIAVRDCLAEELDRTEGREPGFAMEHLPEEDGGALWLYSDGYGEPEHVIRFALRCAETFNLGGRWGLTWALTCSKPRLDGFGGGAQLLDLGARRSLDWIDCEHWLHAALGSDDPPASATR